MEKNCRHREENGSFALISLGAIAYGKCRNYVAVFVTIEHVALFVLNCLLVFDCLFVLKVLIHLFVHNLFTHDYSTSLSEFRSAGIWVFSSPSCPSCD